VSNVDAFTMRYGPGLPVAGAWEEGDQLSNGGEQVKLSFGAGDPIRDFTYDDVAPWPDAPDTTGVSLTLIAPGSVPDHADPTNWRSSSAAGGTPGASEPTTDYSDWQTANFGPGTPPGSGELDDADFDGYENLLEYAFASDPNDGASFAKIEALLVTDGAEQFPAVRYTRASGLPDVTFTVQSSTALDTWESGETATVQVGTTVANGDGTETVTVRSTTPVDPQAKSFLRVMVQSR
jgi:hypothetical protein